MAEPSTPEEIATAFLARGEELAASEHLPADRWWQAATVYAALGRMDEAADRASRVKGGIPKWFAYHPIAVAYAQAGCVEEAFAAAKKVRKKPYPDSVATALESVFVADGRLDRAARAVALLSTPAGHDARGIRESKAAFERGEFDQAKAWLQLVENPGMRWQEQARQLWESGDTGGAQAFAEAHECEFVTRRLRARALVTEVPLDDAVVKLLAFLEPLETNQINQLFVSQGDLVERFERERGPEAAFAAAHAGPAQPPVLLARCCQRLVEAAEFERAHALGRLFEPTWNRHWLYPSYAECRVEGFGEVLRKAAATSNRDEIGDRCRAVAVALAEKKAFGTAYKVADKLTEMGQAGKRFDSFKDVARMHAKYNVERAIVGLERAATRSLRSVIFFQAAAATLCDQKPFRAYMHLHDRVSATDSAIELLRASDHKKPKGVRGLPTAGIEHDTGLALSVAETSSDRNAVRVDGALLGGPSRVWVFGKPGDNWAATATTAATPLTPDDRVRPCALTWKQLDKLARDSAARAADPSAAAASASAADAKRAAEMADARRRVGELSLEEIRDRDHFEWWDRPAKKLARLEAVVTDAAAALLEARTDSGIPGEATRGVLREMLLKINRMNVEDRFIGTLERDHILDIFEALRVKAGLDQERLFDEWRDW